MITSEADRLVLVLGFTGYCRSSGASLKDMLRLCAMEDWDADVVSTLKTASAERAVELFTKEHVAAATQGGTDGQGLSRIQSMLAASRQYVRHVPSSPALVFT